VNVAVGIGMTAGGSGSSTRLGRGAGVGSPPIACPFGGAALALLATMAVERARARLALVSRGFALVVTLARVVRFAAARLLFPARFAAAFFFAAGRAVDLVFFTAFPFFGAIALSSRTRG
jgi:hypothetical protein